MAARIIAQLVAMGVGVVSKAFLAALQQARANGGRAAAQTVRRTGTMEARQARQILNLEGDKFTRAEVMSQYKRYFAANDADKGGSFYLQSKIHNAKECLLEELAEAEGGDPWAPEEEEAESGADEGAAAGAGAEAAADDGSGDRRGK